MKTVDQWLRYERAQPAIVSTNGGDGFSETRVYARAPDHELKEFKSLEGFSS